MIASSFTTGNSLCDPVEGNDATFMGFLTWIKGLNDRPNKISSVTDRDADYLGVRLRDENFRLNIKNEKEESDECSVSANNVGRRKFVQPLDDLEKTHTLNGNEYKVIDHTVER